MEGIGKDLTLRDLYLAELGLRRLPKELKKIIRKKHAVNNHAP
jgi:hypothetical protein